MLTLPRKADFFSRMSSLAGEVFFEVCADRQELRWSADPGVLLLGYAPGELMLNWPELVEIAHHKDRPKLEQTWQRLCAGHTVSADFRLGRKGGGWAWVQLVGGAVEDAEGQSRTGGLLRNIQELHDALASLSKAHEMEIVGTMASGIAHEFNNHLTPISGHIELTLDALGAHHPLVEGLQAALDSVHYCSELVSQIQAYGRKSMLVPEYIDVGKLIPSTIRLALSFFPQLAERIAVQETTADNLPGIRVDRVQFQQALIHLFRNAIEAMQPAGGTLFVGADKVTESGEVIPADHPGVEDGYLRLRIEDTGCGIPAENRSRIFEPFYTTHGRAKARGMGLPMVQGMVAQHGGWMEIKTEVRCGTSVRLFLPAASPEPEAGAGLVYEDGSMNVAPAATVGRLLIADDEPFVRRLIHKILAPEGWQLDDARDNDEVIRLVQGGDHHYRAIILDLTMPGQATEDVVQHILRTDPRARVLFVSGYARDQRIELLLDKIDSEFVHKPFSPTTLITALDDLLKEE